MTRQRTQKEIYAELDRINALRSLRARPDLHELPEGHVFPDELADYLPTQPVLPEPPDSLT